MLSDTEIRALCREAAPSQGPMISPFLDYDQPSPPGAISYGLTSCGYDVRLGGEVHIFNTAFCEAVDPKRMRDPDYRGRVFVRRRFLPGQPIPIPPNSYILGCSHERFSIPRGVVATCVGKSTYARCGIIVNVTPLEPEWAGQLTVEISNSSPLQAYVYCMEGIAQIQFHTIQGKVERSYADKAGIYQDQAGVVHARVRE